jgi:putative ABC transport system substrate-binding protein
MIEQRIQAVIVSGDAYLATRQEQIIALAKLYALPAAGASAPLGGLISYEVRLGEVYRQAGIYAGRILKGEKPGDLPVQLPTKFKLGMNLKTAKALGLEVPPTLLAIADEVIE